MFYICAIGESYEQSWAICGIRINSSSSIGGLFKIIPVKDV